MTRLCLILAPALLAAPAAWGQAAPTICPTAPNTLAMDLGAYHGSVWITDLDGKPATQGNARFDCPAKPVRYAWQGCNFSVCNLPDGDYSFRFSRLPPQAQIEFTLTHGMVRMAATPLAVQVGNYGIDATASRVPVAIDLHGYEGDWSVEGFPGGAFHGTQTDGRAQVQDGIAALSLYPATPYALRFGQTLVAVVSADFDGGLTLQGPPGLVLGHTLVKQGRLLRLRGASLAIAPKDEAAAWHIEAGASTTGPRSLFLPAGTRFTLFDETHATTEQVALDDACHATLAGTAAGHVFKLAPSPGGAGCAP